MLGELGLAYRGLFGPLYETIYIYWLRKRKKQQVRSTKMSNDDYECFKKVIFD